MRPLTIARSKRALLASAVMALFTADAILPFHTAPADAALATGCAVGGAATNSGNFTAANFSLTGVGVSPTGSLQLSTGMSALTPSSIIIPFEQDISAYFVFEFAGHVSTFGWVVKTLAEAQLRASFPGTYPVPPFPATQTVKFADLMAANTAYMAANPGQRLVNFVFPYLQDANNDGILDGLYNPTGVTLAVGAASLTLPAALPGAPPTTEAQLTAAGFTPNGNGTVTSIDSKVSIGHFNGGTELVFFLNDNKWTGSTWFTKASWNQYAGTTAVVAPVAESFSPSATGGNNCDGAGGNSVAKTGKWTAASTDITGMNTTTSLRVGECVKGGVAGIPAGAYITSILSSVAGAGSVRMSVAATATSAAGAALTFGCLKKDVLDSSTSVPKQMRIFLNLGISPPENTGCAGITFTPGGATPTWTQGYVPVSTQARLLADHGLTFTGTIEFGSDGSNNPATPVPHVSGLNFAHWVVISPPSNPFKWIMGVEDWHGTEVSNDYDFNDVAVVLERKTGGMAQLTSANAMSPADPAAYITSVTFSVHDKMPTCAGKISQIDYYLSIDNGVTWVKQLNWDIVQTPIKGGATVANWTYAVPAETYRQNTLNFSELGLTGRQLIWKAEYISQDDTCQPETIGVDISYVAAINQVFSRSAPTTLGNVMYTASFETPAAAWTDKELRGHLKSERIYDPVNPLAGYAVATNWEAGAILTAATPSARNILFPDMTVTSVANEVLGSGNGVIKTFTGTLAHHPLVNTSLSITDTVETFVDLHTSTLQGNFTGTGTINRYTGAYTITFNAAPGNTIPVKANYQYYTTSPTMKQVNAANTTASMLAMDSSSYTDGTGFHYTYDFNADGNATTLLENDADWLIQWTRGYKDGSTATVKKEWLLAAIDHSAPAIVGAPGMPSFYFGTDVNQSYKDSYDLFRCNQRLRPTLAFVGARDGMLHAFYAGEYRPFYYTDSGNVELPSTYSCISSNLTAFRTATNHYTKLDASSNKVPYYKAPGGAGEFNISRGYYDWRTRAGTAQASPNYGDGSESFAVVPVDQLSKLKNNKLKGEDRAFVDASPSVAYVQFADSTWRAVLISAEGNGGNHVFGIDVTDPATPKFLWEFADPDLYRSRSSPSVGIIGRIMTSTGPKWVVFFVSGINTDATASPSVYALDVETGNVIRRVYLDSAGVAGLGGTPSGQPAIIDSDGNGYVDRMYIGTDKGFMYKATLPDNPTAAASDITVCTLYNAGQPIYASPAISLQNTTNPDGTTAFNVVVLFGTSDSPYYTDSTGATFFFYAISDKSARGVCSAGTLQWSFQLPAGQQVFASAFATAGRVYFGTTTADTEDPCSPPIASAGGTTGGIYAMDIKTGATVYSDTTVGNITSTPLVDDEHLYFKSANGTLHARGGNTFQNTVRQGGGGSVGLSSWNELTQ